MLKLAPLAVFSLLALTVPARAQSGPNVTLQLPSFKSTGVNTTVIVPDSGAAPLARERQAFYSRTMYGPRGQRASSRSGAAGGTQVTVQIHDPRAAEAELLRAARERRATWQRGSLAGRRATASSASDGPLLSLAEIRRRQTAAQSAQENETARLLGEARRARAEGKSGAAAVYYQMAARRAAPEERATITSEAARAD